MQQGTPQFTPLQMLEAGRQAEAQGKVDYAVQFYLHLVEFYGQTPEAAEARTALGRMAGAGRVQSVWQPGTVARRARYRSGRALAALLSGLGWLAIAGSLAVMAAGAGARWLEVPVLLQLELSDDLVLRMPFATLLGAALVIGGQAARALFDQANATRELLAMQRGRAGIDPG